MLPRYPRLRLRKPGVQITDVSSQRSNERDSKVISCCENAFPSTDPLLTSDWREAMIVKRRACRLGYLFYIWYLILGKPRCYLLRLALFYNIMYSSSKVYTGTCIKFWAIAPIAHENNMKCYERHPRSIPSCIARGRYRYDQGEYCYTSTLNYSYFVQFAKQ